MSFGEFTLFINYLLNKRLKPYLNSKEADSRQRMFDHFLDLVMRRLSMRELFHQFQFRKILVKQMSGRTGQDKFSISLRIPKASIMYSH